MSSTTGNPEAGPRPAAFFDLDKTLIAGSSLLAMAQGLYRRDLCDAGTVAQLRLQHIRRRMDQVVGASARSVSPAGSAVTWVQGRHRAEVEAVTDEIVGERIAPTVYKDMAALAAKHKSGGMLTYVVTAAPAEVAQTVARRLGMTGGLGTSAETDDAGRYSGRHRGAVLHGQDKAAAVEAHAAEAGVDLAASVGYADSILDAPMLELFGRAEVVNPDAPLRRLAAQKDWPVRQPRTTVDDVDRHRVALVRPRMAAYGLDRLVTAGTLVDTARNRFFTAADPEAFVQAVEATGRFRRDTRIGAIYHPGRMSFREVTAGTSLHITVAGERVTVHVDRVSPLAPTQPDERCRYSLGRIAAHNLSGIAADIAGVLPWRRVVLCDDDDEAA